MNDAAGEAHALRPHVSAHGPSGLFPEFARLELLQWLLANIGPVLACHLGWFATLNTFHKQRFEFLLRLTLLIVANQIANIFTHAAVAPGIHLTVNKLL